MPEVQEVFRMATQKVRPDPGALERQHGEQRRRTIRRKVGVYGLVAALVGVIAVVAVRAGGSDSADPVPGGGPATSPTSRGTQVPIGTVTLDESSCSMEITADRLEAGLVVLDVVNATDQRAMFDSWRILEGFTFRAFDEAVERERRILESGKEYPSDSPFPDQTKEISYLSSSAIPANGSGTLVTTMSPGRHAIVCLKPYGRDGIPMLPFGIVGPLAVR